MEDGADPEDTYTDIPYEKGYAFVSYLRHLVGSDEAFDAWLKVQQGVGSQALAFTLAQPTCLLIDLQRERDDVLRLDWLPDPCRWVHVCGRPM